MCTIPLAIMGTAAAVSAVGSLKAGRDAQSNASAEAAIYQSQATARMEKAAFDISQADNKFKRFEATQITHAAASGIDSQSFYDAFADDAAELELEKQAIRWTAKHDSEYLGYQSDAATRRGRQAQNASYFSAASGVLNAFSPAISARYKSGLESPAGVSTSGYTGNLK